MQLARRPAGRRLKKRRYDACGVPFCFSKS